MPTRELVVFLVFCFAGTFTTLVNAEADIMQYQTIEDMLKDRSTSDQQIATGDIFKAGDWTYEVVQSADATAHLSTAGGLSLRAIPDNAGAVHASQLGWKANENIHEKLVDFVNASSGATHLVIDADYEISGPTINLPDNFTLEGAPNSSISLANVGSRSGVQFSFGSNSEITNMEFVAQGPNAMHQNVRLLEARDVNNFEITNSSFEGNIGIFVDLHDVSNFHAENVLFDGGFYQMRWAGQVDNPTVESSAFMNSAGDGIKTITGEGTGTKDAIITNSLFYNNGRDGIDTTGGFKDSTISNSVFMDNKVSAIDLKTIINDPTDFDVNLMNTGIIIENSEFIDNQNGIVFTTIDRLAAGGFESMSPAQAAKWAVQDIEIKDSTFEYTGGGRKNAFLIKDAHSISWDGITLLGNLREVAEKPNYNWDMPFNIDSTDVSTGSVRSQAYRDALLETDFLEEVPATSVPTNESPASENTSTPEPSVAQDGLQSGGEVPAPNVEEEVEQPAEPVPANTVDEDDAGMPNVSDPEQDFAASGETDEPPTATPPASDVPLAVGLPELDAWISADDVLEHKIGSDGDDRLNFFSSDIALRLTGGLGRDHLVGGNANDLMEGDDDSDTLRGHGGDDFMLGGAGRDFMYGYQGDDRLFGQDGDDRVEGRLGDDYVSGGAGNDILKGDRGIDHLNGGLGSDKLWGGQGGDIFQFDVLDRDAHDQVMDFRDDDAIALEMTVFSELGAEVDADEIEYGSEATSADTRLLFDNDTRYLSYDRDGSGEEEAVLIAHLNGVRDIDASKFILYDASSGGVKAVELADILPVTGQLSDDRPTPGDEDEPDDFALMV